MAIAGGACSAYYVSWDNNKQNVRIVSTTTLRSLCARRDEAVETAAAGGTATVAGDDVAHVTAALRKRMEVAQ